MKKPLNRKANAMGLDRKGLASAKTAAAINVREKTIKDQKAGKLSMAEVVGRRMTEKSLWDQSAAMDRKYRENFKASQKNQSKPKPSKK